MGKAKVKYNEEYLAVEAYAVLIRKERPSRSVTRAQIKAALTRPGVYPAFLKLCAESDGSAPKATAKTLKRGLYLVIQAIGLNEMQSRSGLSRVTLYRMFSKSGNPSLETLLRVFSALDLRLWLVELDFIFMGNKTRRFNKERPDFTLYNEMLERERHGLK